MNNQFAQWDEKLIPFYKRFPVAIVEAKDHTLTDIDGKKYIDFTAGISVVNIGHCNKTVNDAIKAQLNTISHISNIYYIPQQAELSELISQKAFDGKSFFCNSGGEANEAAVKISRYIGNKINSTKNKLLSLNGSFHGRTIATITLTGQDKYKHGFEPLMPRIDIVEYNNIASLESKFDDDVAAIFVEAVQAEGGIRPLSEEFVAAIKKLAKKHNSLVVIDEVQTGIGRTGKNFGYQYYDIQPDIITLAKGLGNGFPVGAIHVKPSVAEQLPARLHASTFGGNYVAMAAGIAVLNLLDDKLLAYVNKISAYIVEKLTDLQKSKPVISEIRARGLLIGVDLDGVNVGDVLLALLERGIAALSAGTNTLRLVPPFTIGEAEVDKLIEGLAEVL